MIRKLSASDNDIVIALLAPEASYNILILGDLENYGYEQEFMDLWGDFGDDGALRAVLMRYNESFTAYAPSEYAVADFIEIISGYKWNRMSGKRSVMERVIPYLEKQVNHRSTNFAELRHLNRQHFELPSGYQLLRAGVQHVDEVVNLTVSSFANTSADSLRDSLQRDLTNGVSTVWCVTHNGKIVSKAQSTAENSQSAMIVGVCTSADYRGKGLATACTLTLCEEHLAKGRALCLFWDDPTAGKIYAKLGFANIGQWMMMGRLQPESA
jgi:predicted GNAT family acetyltransferase